MRLHLLAQKKLARFSIRCISSCPNISNCPPQSSSLPIETIKSFLHRQFCVCVRGLNSTLSSRQAHYYPIIFAISTIDLSCCPHSHHQNHRRSHHHQTPSTASTPLLSNIAIGHFLMFSLSHTHTRTLTNRETIT